jgi:hypothetical protein
VIKAHQVARARISELLDHDDPVDPGHERRVGLLPEAPEAPLQDLLGGQGSNQLGKILGGARLGQLRDKVGVDGLQDRVLAFEVIVEGAFLDADRPGQLSDRHGAVAVLREQRDGRFEDSLLGMGQSHLWGAHRGASVIIDDLININ